MAAALQGTLPIVKLLLAAGADISVQNNVSQLL
jgi:ankyrin repeat protein